MLQTAIVLMLATVNTLQSAIINIIIIIIILFAKRLQYLSTLSDYSEFVRCYLKRSHRHRNCECRII